jgi:hypothetical protein
MQEIASLLGLGTPLRGHSTIGARNDIYAFAIASLKFTNASTGVGSTP